MLPILFDSKDALDYLANTPHVGDPQRAYVIAFLSREGWTNRQIRKQLGIDKVYTLTHFKRVGLSLSEAEFSLWGKNPTRITLGHLRAVCHLNPLVREPLLRIVLAQNLSVAKLLQRLKDQTQSTNADIKRYETQMEESLGRGVKIQFNASRQSGKLTLDFFGLDDLDHLSTTLGFTPDQD